MRRVLEFLLEHERYLRSIKVKMVIAGLEKLDMDRILSKYEIHEFCQMKAIVTSSIQF